MVPRFAQTPILHKVQNSKIQNILLFSLFHILLTIFYQQQTYNNMYPATSTSADKSTYKTLLRHLETAQEMANPELYKQRGISIQPTHNLPAHLCMQIAIAEAMKTWENFILLEDSRYFINHPLDRKIAHSIFSIIDFLKNNSRCDAKELSNFECHEVKTLTSRGIEIFPAALGQINGTLKAELEATTAFGNCRTPISRNSPKPKHMFETYKRIITHIGDFFKKLGPNPREGLSGYSYPLDSLVLAFNGLTNSFPQKDTSPMVASVLYLCNRKVYGTPSSIQIPNGLARAQFDDELDVYLLFSICKNLARANAVMENPDFSCTFNPQETRDCEEMVRKRFREVKNQGGRSFGMVQAQGTSASKLAEHRTRR
jgi:hypothetical protein